MKQIKQLMIVFVMCAFSLVSISGTAHANLLGDIIGGINALSGAPNGYVLISGKVVNEEMEPLEGVSIKYLQAGYGRTETVFTDANGNYSIKIPSGKEGKLIYELQNYRTIKFGVQGIDSTINQKMHFDSLTGKVVDSEGYPVEGAVLSFEQDGGRSGILSVKTDENGNYEVHIPEDYKYYWVTIKCDGYDVVRTTVYGVGGWVANFTLK